MGSRDLPRFDTDNLARIVESMPIDAIDALDFGAIRLDRSGTVTFYSKTEAEQSGRGPRPTVGLKFFTDVAPCMNNPAFRGRIEAAIAAGTLDIEFNHVGDFADRDRELCVRAQSASDGGVWIFHQRVE